MTRTFLAGLLAVFFAASPGFCGDIAPEEADSGPGKARPLQAPAYRPYFYNYPHALPSDYVFRTGRVFSPRNMRQSFLERLMPGSFARAGETADSGGGAEFSSRIARLGQSLMANAGEEVLDDYAVAVTTFVNLDNLYATSSLGRYLGEQLLGELRQAGMEVVEVRKTPGLLVSSRHGEYALSRDMAELSAVQNVQALLVGTYTVTGTEVLVNARLLRNEDNRVLAAATMILPLGPLASHLLADESMPAAAMGTSPVTVRAFEERASQPPAGTKKK